MKALSVEIIDDTSKLTREQLEFLTRRAVDAVRAMNAAGEVRVRVIDDAAMSAAHEEYTGVSGTTDVLTFDMSDPPEVDAGELPAVWCGIDEVTGGFRRESLALDVDIMICFDEAVRRSGEYGHAPESELLLYVVHGALHCLGYDDHDEEEFERMHDMEDVILEKIGVGRLFRRGGAS